MAKPASASPQLTRDDVKFMETALSSLPSGPNDQGWNEADGLLRFGYHQNPYMRTCSKVLWSGFAISRNQLADGHQRFSQARRDATVSAVDQGTTQAMDAAAKALEDAMSPAGSLSGFLAELRDRTMPRLWARVCETANLPPPSFAVIYKRSQRASADELDDEDELELAALRKQPAGAPPQLPAVAAVGPAAETPESDDGDDDEDGSADEPASGAPALLQVQVERDATAETVAEWLLLAATEALREVRRQAGQGPLKVTIRVQGMGQERTQSDDQRSRRRRRRRR